jgi:hypothetical protein
MAWIKRNLYFVITIFVGLGVTGYCGYLLYSALGDNAAATEAYNTDKTQLDDFYKKSPFPTKENIQAAKTDAERVRAFLADFRKPFAPFPTPPSVDNRQFKDYLQKSVIRFGAEATNAGVELNPNYTFSWSQQMDKLSYPAENIAPWMQELVEETAILHILYKAKINFLERIERPSVSPDDQGGNDNVPFPSVTNQWGVVTPYRVFFRAFSAEIANVLAGIAASSNCFIVKGIYVTKSLVPLPEVNTPSPQPSAPVQQYRPPPQRFPEQYPPNMRDRDFRERRPFIPTPPPTATVTPTGPSGPVTILRELPLFVTLYIDVVKLKPAETNAVAAKPRTAGR